MLAEMLSFFSAEVASSCTGFQHALQLADAGGAGLCLRYQLYFLWPVRECLNECHKWPALCSDTQHKYPAGQRSSEVTQGLRTESSLIITALKGAMQVADLEAAVKQNDVAR